MKSLLFLLLLVGMYVQLGGQTFTEVSNPANAIINHPTNSAYTGCSWIDYNNDGLLDLFVNPNYLYRNDGNGAFTAIEGIPTSGGLGGGNTWGDIDNDGDLDLVIAASPSKMYINEEGTFEAQSIIDQPLDSFNFWSPTLGDYNADGWLDLFLTHPAGFLPTTNNAIRRKSLLLQNDGTGAFQEVTDTPTDDEEAAYTVGSWTDYDLDGDLDLFIGSGEVGFPSLDHIYINELSQTDTANLTRLTTGALAEDMRDGQNWNFIDYDNDGDLDAFVTNYLGTVRNDLYRNDSGTYVKTTSGEVGTIAFQGGAGLCNLWADFDNDGFIDCYVNFDGPKDRFYHNNGDGTFTEENKAMSVIGTSRGATAGDYNNDGFMDLFVASATSSSLGLYRNNGNGNKWIKFKLTGISSNTTAIGAKVKVKAMIGDTSQWQIREVNSQNSFNGHNSYEVHFGLLAAETIDSLIIEWPSGIKEQYASIASNQVCEVVEDNMIDCIAISSNQEVEKKIQALQIFPNPADKAVRFYMPSGMEHELKHYRLTDLEGKIIQQDSTNQQVITLNTEKLSAGMYFVRVESDKGQAIGKLIKR